MGVVTFTDSKTSPVPPAKLFKALFLEGHIYIPKAAPHIIKSVEIIEGSGGPGSIQLTTFVEGAAPVKFLKHKIDVVDKDSFTFADTLIEGGELSDKILSVTHEAKFESSPDGGTVTKAVVKYHLKEGAELTEEEVKPAKEGAHAVFKAVEAYALANDI